MRIEISGGQIPSFFGQPVHGLVVTGTFTTLKSLVINGFHGAGIELSAVDSNRARDRDPPPGRSVPKRCRGACRAIPAVRDHYRQYVRILEGPADVSRGQAG